MAASSCYREVHLQLKLPKWPIMFIKTGKEKKKDYSLSQLSEEQLSCNWKSSDPCCFSLSPLKN
jgi:hypothetical protein